MNYTKSNDNNQTKFEIEIPNSQEGVLVIPSCLDRFYNTQTICKEVNNKTIILFKGFITLSDKERTCDCGSEMHIHKHYVCQLKHIPIGGSYTIIEVEYVQLLCPKCGCTKIQNIPFKDEGHFITKQAKTYINSLLRECKFTGVEISLLTGINRNIIKEIDKEWLINTYTVENEDKTKSLIKPGTQSKYLAIDEFKLHNGYKFATHIIDLESGHILWIANGKKKQVVYDFIEHVGLEWMKGVKAVACDMNSDFEEAFKEKCPHIKIVFDYFHIVKHLNEAIGNIRKSEQRRLEEAGDKEGAKSLKNSRYILTSSMETLIEKDKEALECKVIKDGSDLFKTPDVIRKGTYRETYENIINNNETLLVTELIKELLSTAYKTDNKKEMEDAILDIMWLCEENGNKYLIKFMKLLYNHLDGIVTHSDFKISSGKIEGINNKIKTLRREAYGYPDDEYFFLKLFDMSRH